MRCPKLIEGCNCSCHNRGYAETAINENFTEDEVKAFATWLFEAHQICCYISEVQLPISSNTIPFSCVPDGSGYIRVHETSCFQLPFDVEGYFEIPSAEHVLSDSQNALFHRGEGGALEPTNGKIEPRYWYTSGQYYLSEGHKLRPTAHLIRVALLQALADGKRDEEAEDIIFQLMLGETDRRAVGSVGGSQEDRSGAHRWAFADMTAPPKATHGQWKQTIYPQSPCG